MINDIRMVTMKLSMALLKEQELHPNRCIHCNFLQSGLEKDGAISVKHDTMCPVVAASQMVAAFNSEMVRIDA